MTEPSLTEKDAIRRAVSDHATRTALMIFCANQRELNVSQLVTEMKKPSPDVLQAAQTAGRIDVYERLVNELEHFVKV